MTLRSGEAANADAAESRRLAAARHPSCDDFSPADRYGELFTAVQGGGVFPDSKTFVDCAPRGKPEDILRKYRTLRADSNFDLVRFVDEHFDLPQPVQSDWHAVPAKSLVEHIDALWPVLKREPALHI